MTIYLTPDQLEKIESGWYVAVVLGPADIDVLHSGLTLPYCDDATHRLMDDITGQIKQVHLLGRVQRIVDGPEVAGTMEGGKR